MREVVLTIGGGNISGTEGIGVSEKERSKKY